MSSSGPTLSHTHGFHNVPRGPFTVTPAPGSTVQQSPGRQQYAMLPRVGNPTSITSVHPNPNVEREKRRAGHNAAANAATNAAATNAAATSPSSRKRSTRKRSRKQRSRKQRR
jgi:hypothetical protein